MNNPEPQNFIRNIISKDVAAGKNDGRVATRFPPEPNGYLHIGHAKSICLNFVVADDYDGRCNLRFDDTNPEKESEEYAQAIIRDIQWLGFEWDELRHASDYFDQLHEFAQQLIRAGHAYVDSQDAETMRANRGTLTEPGVNSPHRDRNVEENLDLFARMRAGEFAEGAHVLRAKIDMSSPNLNMRDPVIYRIRHINHQRAGDAWCVYPMYDFTHCLSDAIEGITHSLCTLEFEDHRPLYDWFIDHVDIACHPQQIEFSRLELLYAVTSKRKLLQLVEEGHVDGWDDPRMPTISGMRRRGYPPEAIRDFCARAGVAKSENKMPLGDLEHSVREALGPTTPRIMAVLDPIKVVLTNYPEDRIEEMHAPLHPHEPEMGSKVMPFGREILIERDDYLEDAPKKYFRLKPGGCVRLRNGYIIDFQEAIKDAEGNIIELRCTYDPETKSGEDNSGRKVKGVIHWVHAPSAGHVEVRQYDRLFTTAKPDGHPEKDFKEFINPDSLNTITARVEPQAMSLEPGARVQFERVGYFVADEIDSEPGKPVFNQIVTLRDSWGKIEKGQG